MTRRKVATIFRSISPRFAADARAANMATFEQLDTISPRPLLVIAGSKVDTLFWSRQVHEKAREPKELHLIEGATHIDMYDRPQFVAPAVAKLADFFGRHLRDASRSSGAAGRSDAMGGSR